MLTTKGIVIHSIKYSETSIIVKIFTEDIGLQTFIIKGVRSKKAKMKAALFQPLQMLEVSFAHRESKKMLHMHEAKSAIVYQSIPFDNIKRSVMIFLTEILNRSLKENLPDRALFNWLWQALLWYDLNDERTIDFHLVFLIQLTRFLGFYPKHISVASFRYFDLKEGIFVNYEPFHPHYISGETATLFNKITSVSFNNIEKLVLSTSQRSKLINSLTEYYRLHIENFGEVKSLEVLRELF